MLKQRNKPEPRTATRKTVAPAPKTTIDAQERLPENEQVFLSMLSSDERAYLKKINKTEERMRKKLMRG